MRFAIAMIFGLSFGSKEYTLAPVPEPEPRLQWEWSELEGELEGYLDSIKFSSDGKLVAVGLKDKIFVWSAETKKQLTRMQLPNTFVGFRLAFSADGKELISVTRPDDNFRTREFTVRTWDIKTGKQLKEFARERAITGLELFDLVHGRELKEVPNRSSVGDTDPDPHYEAAVAPDGKSFAAMDRSHTRMGIFDSQTFKIIREFALVEREWSLQFGKVRYSSDGRYLYGIEAHGQGFSNDSRRLVIWGVEDGKRYTDIKNQTGVIGPGSRYLLTDTQPVYDLLTDDKVSISNAPADRRNLIGMSADGSILAFRGTSPTDRNKFAIYLTPAPILASPIRPGEILTNETGAKAWAGVIAENAFRRNYYTKALANRPELAIQLAQLYVQPVPLADAEKVDKLIRDLGDEKVEVSDKAQTDLEDIGKRFVHAITAARKAEKPGDKRNRMTAVLRSISESDTPAALIVDLRGVAFLEGLNTPEARKHLKTIADGAAGARLTLEAKAALARIDSTGK